MVKTFCVIFCACQCQFERKFWNFELFWFFCEILSRLRKNVEVMLAFRVLLEGHFGAPKNCKSWALVRTRAQFWQFSLTYFFHFFSDNYKKHENWALVRTRAQLLRTRSIKKTVLCTCIEFRHFAIFAKHH